MYRQQLHDHIHAGYLIAYKDIDHFMSSTNIYQL